jgi:hypothetical protein
MSNTQLRAKFIGQAEPVLGTAKAAGAWSLCMEVARCPDMHALLEAGTLPGTVR